MFVASYENTMRNAKPKMMEGDGTVVRTIDTRQKEKAAAARTARQREIALWKARTEEIRQRIEDQKKAAISNYLENGTTAVSDIIAYVAAVHGFTPAEILSHRRNRDLCTARHEAMTAVAEARPDLSLPQLGRHFKRDHTTILHALAKTSGTMRRTRSKPA